MRRSFLDLAATVSMSTGLLASVNPTQKLCTYDDVCDQLRILAAMCPHEHIVHADDLRSYTGRTNISVTSCMTN